MNTGANAVEVNFECIVGPTHYFGGLSYGNLASTQNKARSSSPKKAALQSLAKMYWLHTQGFVQGMLPPHERPHQKSLANLGFSGPLHEAIFAVSKKMPEIFLSLCSSSSMWAANAATVSPSFDSCDHKMHISPANLVSMFHRSIEADFTHRVCKRIFHDDHHFFVHDPLPSHLLFADEGAANHNRLAPDHAHHALQIFVYGKDAQGLQKSSIFPARQSLLANQALIKRHMLEEIYVLNLEQNALAIDAGAFHNDVVSVSNGEVFLSHELAFQDPSALKIIEQRYEQLFDRKLYLITIDHDEVSLAQAVSSYLFNSQILSKNDGHMLLLAPAECNAHPTVQKAIQRILDENNPINAVNYFDISESMANGGGPACLRLRMAMSTASLQTISPTVILNENNYHALCDVVNTYYVDEFDPRLYFDRSFIDNATRALDEISKILGLHSIYDFQQ